jgi:hypothetical protein
MGLHSLAFPLRRERYLASSFFQSWPPPERLLLRIQRAEPLLGRDACDQSGANCTKVKALELSDQRPCLFDAVFVQIGEKIALESHPAANGARAFWFPSTLSQREKRRPPDGLAHICPVAGYHISRMNDNPGQSALKSSDSMGISHTVQDRHDGGGSSSSNDVSQIVRACRQLSPQR